ncbi:MAG: ABC transporter ATP-binding protein [Gemmataceae bacterium]|nr:ABC transporter ATP-binding protein [Gemmataceae bacterium]
MRPAIRVEQLAKRYQLGSGQADSYRTLRESISSAAARPWRWLTSRAPDTAENSARPKDLWALRDVSFEVPVGKIVGIVGRNGAGKSTLLKVLSRVTEPTAGRVEVRGRVGSLLEVGIGFHTELTGRENIFLSGVILGMSRQEVARKFDAIVAFADIEKFLDTPVKRYSSGMYVRLAFAVAAHMDPEILIVDEVLAVGDAQFQKKCLGKLEDVSQSGRTVFLVSHNMQVVQRLCNHVLYLDGGRLVDGGDKDAVLHRYLSSAGAALRPGEPLDLSRARRRGSQEARFVQVRYASDHHEGSCYPYPDGPLDISVVIHSEIERTVPRLAAILSDRAGNRLILADTLLRGQSVSLRRGRNAFTIRIEQMHLNPGEYVLGLYLANSNSIIDFIESAAPIDVLEHPTRAAVERPQGDGLVSCSVSVRED